MGWYFNGPFAGAFYHISNYPFISFFRNNVSTQVLATLPKDFSESIKGTLIKFIFKTCLNFGVSESSQRKENTEILTV